MGYGRTIVNVESGDILDKVVVANLRHYANIYLNGLRKVTKILTGSYLEVEPSTY